MRGNDMNNINILLTSVGRRSYLVKYFKEALGENGKVLVANSGDMSPAFNVADGSVVTPLIYDENYIPFLLDYCVTHKIKAIISLFDIDLPILSKHKSDFEKLGIKVIVSNYEIVSICNDKWETFRFLSSNGFNVPKTYIKLDDLKNDLSDGIVKFPIIIKPRWGMGSIGVNEADNLEELEILYNKTVNTIKKTYLKFESSVDYDNCVVLQEKISGTEYGLDIINDLKANHVNTVVKRKIAMRSGETDCAVTVNNDQLKEIGKKLSSITKHIANMDVDVFVDNDKIYVLEMNARFGGGYPFSHMAGVNLPLAIIKWLDNQPVLPELLTEKYDVLAHKDIDLVLLKKPHTEKGL